MCYFYLSKVEEVADDIRPIWTWNDSVRLVAGHARVGQFDVVKNIRAEPSIANIERTVGILPEL